MLQHLNAVPTTKKGKKNSLGNDPDEYKSFNVAQREILQ